MFRRRPVTAGVRLLGLPSMLPKTRFRRILLSSVAVGIAYIPASIIGDQRLPDELVAFNNARFEQDLTATEMVAVVIGLPLSIAAIINPVGRMALSRVLRGRSIISEKSRRTHAQELFE